MRRDRKKSKSSDITIMDSVSEIADDLKEDFSQDSTEIDFLEELNLSQEPFCSEVVDLRQRVLHPIGPLERVSYLRDRDVLAIHILVRRNNELIAVGSLLPEDEAEQRNLAVWRIRGMAVHPEMQGKGLGGLVLQEMFDVLKNTELKTKVKAELVWCNARVEALNLYQRFGFKILPGTFDIPGSGPHSRLHLKRKP